MIPKYDTYSLPLVKTDLVFCKPLKFPPVENEAVDESGAVSREQTDGCEYDTPPADTEWPATALALRMPLVIAFKYSQSFSSELCLLAFICLICWWISLLEILKWNSVDPSLVFRQKRTWNFTYYALFLNIYLKTYCVKKKIKKVKYIANKQKSDTNLKKKQQKLTQLNCSLV